MLTKKQRKILLLLLSGRMISGQAGRYVVIDKRINPEMGFRRTTFVALIPFLRMNNDGFSVLDYSKVKKLRKNSWLKKTYNKVLFEKRKQSFKNKN